MKKTAIFKDNNLRSSVSVHNNVANINIIPFHIFQANTLLAIINISPIFARSDPVSGGSSAPIMILPVLNSLSKFHIELS